jgi:tetratricopeptide (TPR) repeat protein
VLTNYEWNWSEAEKEFKLSIELNDDYATAHQWYAIHFLTARARWDDALAEMKKAVELEPASLVMNSFMGATLHYAGRTDEAIEQLRKTIEMDPNFAVAHWYLGLAYEQKNMYAEAIAEFQQAIKLSGGSPLMKAALAHAFAKTERKADAITILNELNELSKRSYLSSYEVAAVYVALGDNEQAFHFLERAYKERCFHLVFLKVWPQFAPVRSDPRFRDLLSRIGLSD